MNIELKPATISDYSIVQNMASYYVYDRTGYMGWPWSVAVMPENIQATNFWRKVVNMVSRGQFTEVFKTEIELRTPENPDPYAMNIISFNV